MKLLLLALVAIASAEPDSFYPYTNVGYSHYQYPTTYNGYVNGITGYSGYSPLYNTYRSSYYNRLYKRDAEAEAEPNHHLPQVYNQYPYVYNSYPMTTHVSQPVFKQGTFHTNLQNIAQGVRTPYPGYGQVYQSHFNTHVKREAESDSESYYPGYPYTYSGQSIYNTPHVVYNTPHVYSAGLYNNYSPYTSYYNRFAKRDADSNSDSDSDSDSYYYYGNPARSTFYNNYNYPRYYSGYNGFNRFNGYSGLYHY